MHLFLIIQYKVSFFFVCTGVFIRSIKQIFLTLARQREMKIYANVCKLLSTNVAKTRSFRVFFLHGWSNIRMHCEYNILTKWLSYLEAYKYKGYHGMEKTRYLCTDFK